MRGASSCTTRLLCSTTRPLSSVASFASLASRGSAQPQHITVLHGNNINVTRGAFRRHRLFATTTATTNVVAVRGVGTTMGEEGYVFGPIRIPPTQVFVETALSVGLVNLKPVVPGHVLIVSRRVAPRFADLTPEETADLWQLAKRVGSVLEPHFGATSLTYAIQARAGRFRRSNRLRREECVVREHPPRAHPITFAGRDDADTPTDTHCISNRAQHARRLHYEPLSCEGFLKPRESL